MCSSVLGPAMPPPFVTCPTTKTAVPLSFAKRISRAAHSRTWPTLPGAPSRSCVNTVWMESTTITEGACATPVAMIVSSSVSLSNETSPAAASIRSARSLTCSGDSSPDTYSTRSPRSSSRAATCSRSVDLPMPGSPPMSTMEPGTMPPPSTKSNSSIPLRQRRSSEPDTSRSRGVTATVPPSPIATLPPSRRSAPAPFAAAALGAAISSTRVFHSPQLSHRPCHLGYSAPQSEQR